MVIGGQHWNGAHQLDERGGVELVWIGGEHF